MNPTNRGDVWNGHEFVSPARYEEQRATTMPHLPPIQESPRLDPVWLPTTNDATTPLATVFRQLLLNVDPEPERGGIKETPERAAKAWLEWTSGYNLQPEDILKTFEDGAEGCDEMVVVHDIPVYSHCEHHLAPIFGTATIGYLPNKRIVGLSKLNRLVDMYARRLQVQERMTNQIADALMTHLQPRGVGVVIKARHFCMESRGVKHQGCMTTTSSMLGLFRSDSTVRGEFLALTR